MRQLHVHRCDTSISAPSTLQTVFSSASAYIHPLVETKVQIPRDRSATEINIYSNFNIAKWRSYSGKMYPPPQIISRLNIIIQFFFHINTKA